MQLAYAWQEQKERAYFKLGNLLSAETQPNSLPNLKYTLSFCAHHISNIINSSKKFLATCKSQDISESRHIFRLDTKFVKIV